MKVLKTCIETNFVSKLHKHQSVQEYGMTHSPRVATVCPTPE